MARPAGTPNKLTAAVKDAILGAFDAVGGQDYLVRIAVDDPKTFCALLGKILPTQLSNADGETLKQQITVRIVDAGTEISHPASTSASGAVED